MSKIIFASNRLPVTVQKNTNEGFTYQKSIGGLATGLKSYHEQSNGLWVGWPGIADEKMNREEKKAVQKELLENHQCLPVF